ncbi:hypothetical protein SAMN05216223_101268 [Actinacidiphila yanglinensis]|uniref:Uncharacterized protein n=1 Tax=Actinacidiphila yanglinensis TaxID=310779 RepID=A0A1H5SVA7_9ACTN|nr:hypothetical protein SAMN05216223_101268 [Actinacidiphila yanglinensis]
MPELIVRVPRLVVPLPVAPLPVVLLPVPGREFSGFRTGHFRPRP